MTPGKRMPENLTDPFIHLIRNTGETEIPPHVLHHARRCLLDYLGATFAGAALAKEKLVKLHELFGPATGPASLLGLGKTSSLQTAAFLNGISSHTAELDDGVISGIIHPGAPLFSALIPFAQCHRTTDQDFLRGVVCGYETSVRLANAIQPSHKRCGYHATATCGAIGATMAILTMCNAAPAVLKHGFSASATSTGGSLKVLEDQSQLKPYNPGHAAVNAIQSACMALSGFEGPMDPLEGPAGFISQMCREFNPEPLSHIQGKYAIEDVYFKPYAACRYCHPAIEAALEMRTSHKLLLDAIEEIKVSTYELAVKHHDHTTVSIPSSAKMSIPYSVAVAICTGAAGLNEYSQKTIGSTEIQSLMQRIKVVSDPVYTSNFPLQTSARVEIVLSNGSRLSEVCTSPKGDPDTALTDDEVIAKFLDLATYSGYSKSDSEKIVEDVWKMPRSALDFMSKL